MREPGDVEHAAFLSKLTDDEARAFEERGTTRKFARGGTIFAEDDRSDRVALITQGRVKISYHTAEGREVLLSVRGPSDLLGEMSVLDGLPRSATAVALDPVDALILSGEDFREFLRANPRVALLLLEMLSLRLREADAKRIEFGAFDTVGRVAQRLVELSARFGETTERGVRITLPLSQQELAAWTGASREAVSKALHSLRQRGLIETHRRGITVLDPEGLMRRAR